MATCPAIPPTDGEGLASELLECGDAVWATLRGKLLSPRCPTGYATPAASVAFADFDAGRAQCGIDVAKVPVGANTFGAYSEPHDQSVPPTPDVGTKDGANAVSVSTTHFSNHAPLAATLK